MKRSALATLFTLCLTASLCPAENWPHWRGPRYDGVSRESGLPTEWDDSKNVLWKAPLPGIGSGTPVVWGERIFLTSQAGEDLLLLCFDTAGKELWRHRLGRADRGARADENNAASPSPSTDGKLVFALVGSGDFVAVDFSGKEAWRFNVQERY